MSSRPGVDIITLEVIRNRLESIVREMGDITLRTARSSAIFNGRDFSCGILNRRYELLAVGTSVPAHIFPIVWQVNKTMGRFEGDVRPGDVFVGNDPYDGGTHLNDVLIFTPVFHDDDLVGFSCNRAHWADIGGMVPGSLSGSATEIYQEGLRIPPIRIGREEHLDPNVLELILRNVRIPRETMGDIQAQVASCRVAAQRMVELIHRYGKQAVLHHFDEILDSAERRMRDIIRALPRTTVVHESYLDNDGVQAERKRIRVAVTVGDGNVVVDYTGTAPQSKGPINVTPAMATCFAFMGVKSALDPKGPINSGCFRPIQIIAPEGTMLNARPPAAGGGYTEVGQAAILTMVALSKLVPGQVSAEEPASASHTYLGGMDLRLYDPHRFIYIDYPPGGGGARADKDGLDFVRSIRSGNVWIQSVEVLENVFPVKFCRHELREDSGGPGKFRGGLGAVREYQTSSEGVLSVLGDHSSVPMAGVLGGRSGAVAMWEFVRQGQPTPVSPILGSKATGAITHAGDIIRIATAGGGGYGDPLERDPARVRADVLDGKVSLGEARRSYGVIVVGEDRTVDVAATQRERAKLKRSRTYLTLRKREEAVFADGMRIAFVHPSLKKKGVREGDLAEIHAPRHPAPLRVRVGFDATLSGDAILLDPEAWDTLELEPCDQVLWQKVR